MRRCTVGRFFAWGLLAILVNKRLLNSTFRSRLVRDGQEHTRFEYQCCISCNCDPRDGVGCEVIDDLCSVGQGVVLVLVSGVVGRV